MMKLSRFATYAWVVLVYNIAVILWGAYVRASKSGAGCGSHWPLCNGVVIPPSPTVETIVEFTHRATSGIALLLVVGLLFWAYRAFPRGHIVRFGAKLSLFFIITEALIGAGLVLFEWVAHDESMGRALSMALHLVNTFLLLAALSLTAWWASGGQPLRLRGQGIVGGLLGLGIFGTLLVGLTGALIALGDTLFPSSSLSEGLRQDFSSTAHFLVRLRPLHPIIAVIVGIYLASIAGVVSSLRRSPQTKLFGRALVALFGLQLLAGGINVLLLVPVWMQLVHLLLADMLWIVLVLFSASALAQDVPAAAATEQATSISPITGEQLEARG
jgi:heme A synthase